MIFRLPRTTFLHLENSLVDYSSDWNKSKKQICETDRIHIKPTKTHKKACEYDLEISQSHTTDQPTAPQGRATEN